MRCFAMPGWVLGVLCLAAVGRMSASPTAAEAGRTRPDAGVPFRLEGVVPDADRWMYPYNATPGTRPAAPVFSSFSGDLDGDTRTGQFLLGWTFRDPIPVGFAPERYVVTSVRVILTTLREGSFVNDSTPDPFESALFPDDPRFVADADPGRPVELFGAGFRNGFTAATFQETSPFGGIGPGERSAFAAGFNERREWVDVSNQVGKTNASFAPFPARAFATGVLPSVAAGEPVPADSEVIFDLELGDPDVRGYVQEALSSGRLWLVATWLGRSGGVGGNGMYPDFATRDNLLHNPPRLVMEGLLLGEVDEDRDGLPDDWERHFLGGTDSSGPDDPDGDGAPNEAEWMARTDPARAGSVLSIPSLRVRSDGRPTLDLVDDGPGRPRVEVSGDWVTWEPAEGVLRFPVAGRGEWTAAEPLGEGAKFFRVVRGR